MTKIIILMWLADISASVGIVGSAILIAFGIALVVILIGLFFKLTDDELDIDSTRNAFIKLTPVVKWPAIFLAVAVLMPNASTLRLAAAGVAIGEIAQTATAQKALDAFNAALDEIISKTKKDKK